MSTMSEATNYIDLVKADLGSWFELAPQFKLLQITFTDPQNWNFTSFVLKPIGSTFLIKQLFFYSGKGFPKVH
jgi:hypothetical protein